MVQRAFYALMACLSLFAVNLRPTYAQVRPDANPSAVDHSSEHGNDPDHLNSSVIASSKDASNASAENGARTEDRTSLPSRGNVYTLPADRTVDDVVARNSTLVIEGHVNHDVLAISSNVLLKPGAVVGNYVNVIGGSVDNEAGDTVHVVRQDAGLIPDLAGTAGAVSVTASTPPSHVRSQSWHAAQFALWILGLLVGLLTLVVAPHTARRTTEFAAAQPRRCFALGSITTMGLTGVLVCGALLAKLPFGLLLKPFVYALAFFCVAALAFGWVCGIALLGEFVQSKTGHTCGKGAGWFKSVVIGLSLFLFGNILLNGIGSGLGVVGLLTESACAVTGLGSAAILALNANTKWGPGRPLRRL